jgi:O-antigen ligase
MKQTAIMMGFTGVFIIGSIGQRTGFLIIFLSSLVFLILTRKDVISYFIYGFLLLLLVNISLLIDLSWLYESRIYQRFFVEDSDGGFLSTRSDIWENAYEVFMNNPDGVGLDKGLDGFTYAHNLWLDVGLRAGYITVLPLMALSMMFLWKNIKIINFKNNLSPNLYLSLISVSIISTFMVEPIMEGYSIFFASFAFIFGILSGFVELNSLKNE